MKVHKSFLYMKESAEHSRPSGLNEKKNTEGPKSKRCGEEGRVNGNGFLVPGKRRCDGSFAVGGFGGQRGEGDSEKGRGGEGVDDPCQAGRGWRDVMRERRRI